MAEYTPAQFAKAIAAFATGMSGGLVTAAAQEGITGVELCIAFLAAIGSCAAVFAIPNRGGGPAKPVTDIVDDIL